MVRYDLNRPIASRTLPSSLVGVGLEELGVEEFVAGKFFDGELFLDTQKKSYEAMGFKRFGILASIPELLKVGSFCPRLIS